VGLFTLLKTPENVITTYSSVNGNEKVMLPDQSEVWLNKNTTLIYCQNNKQKQREIDLKGEALFKVVKNGQPFIVHTPQQVDTKVLGTEFNLKAYASDQRVQLYVISGKVSFGNKESNVMVVKGQQVEFICDQNQLSEIQSIDENLLGWKTGIFVFNNESLINVAEQIGNYIDKTIELPIGSDNLQYSGSFTEPTAEDFAQIISVALNWNYTITDQKVTFNKK
jgi:ferric-dicitrate binding protein FerR (iron transport regulator)